MPAIGVAGVLDAAFVLAPVSVCVEGGRHPSEKKNVAAITIAHLILRSYLIELERNVASGAEGSGALAVEADWQ
jgi:hypothetical protein